MNEQRSERSREGSLGHVPVLLERCVALLAPAISRPGAVVVDATLGLGGHSEALLAKFPELTLVGIDRDPQALEIARRRLKGFDQRVHLVHAVFDELPRVLADLGFGEVDGVLFDLGVSSMQLDEDERGFTYQADVALDMRMNPEQSLTAAEVLNTYSERELAQLLRRNGDEKFADRIAKAVVKARSLHPLETTGELVELVKEAIPAAARRTGGHPAKRSFQALRIEVNDELGVLREAIPAALAAVGVGGRVVVLSYQSLEDKIVKGYFAEACADRLPADLPVAGTGDSEFTSLTRGAELAGEAEIGANRRAKPVRLRAVERRRAA